MKGSKGRKTRGTLAALPPEAREILARAARRIRRLETIVDAARLVNSSLHLRTLLGIILDTAVRMTGAARGTLWLVDQEKRELRSEVTSGARHAGLRLPLGVGIAGHVAHTGETVNLPNAYADPRFNPDIDRLSGFVTRSMLCMPLRAKKREIIGVFQLLNKKGRAFDADDEEFILELSGHAAIAIANARMAERMVQEGRLTVVGRMAASIVHDIRNPLHMLRLSVEMIGGKTDDPGIREILGMMIVQIDRFSSMAEEIIDFSRGTASLRIDRFEVADLLDEVTAIYAGKISSRNVRLKRRAEYDGPFEGDFDKLLRLLQNLVGNALDALPKGGTLTIAAEKEGRTLRLTVADDGPGIPEEVRERLFEPFQTHGKKHGTGLGLAIVKKIAEDHGGSVRVESGAGEGTRMIVSLPFRRPGDK